ncbi:hypothetical protein BH10PSE18_BH10PSE18_50350 [soil metagenome]
MTQIANEDHDPVGEIEPGPRDVRAELRAIAERAGLIRPGDSLDQNQLDFAHGVIELCASIGDRYGDGECGGNAGEHIRAELHE